MIDHALSLTQPWATLLVAGEKRVETRSWRTPYRGWLGIHASKDFPRWAIELCFEEPFRSALVRAEITKPKDLPRGALIGYAHLIDCVPTSGGGLISSLESRVDLGEKERAFGDYSPGRYGWLFDRVVFCEPVVPMKGALGIWRLPTSERAA